MTVRDFNRQQGNLFRQAYRRANRAISAGFYLEAVSLSESLILNRLEVVLRHSAGVSYPRYSVGKVINTLKSHKVHAFDKTLWEDCESWAKTRGELSHKFAFVELAEGKGWLGRIKVAKGIAIEGLALANRCSREATKHKI